MMKKFLLLVTLISLLAACGGEPSPTPAPPTATAVVVEEIPAEPTGTPTAVPEPEPTAEPTVPPSPTPIPTPSGPQASIIDVINQVEAHPVPEGDWEAALEEMIIFVGGEVWAHEASTARVGLEQMIMRVAPNTVFTFGQPEGDTLQLDLQEGQIWLNVEGLDPGTTFKVETPNAVASVRGTRFSVRTDNEGGTLVSTQVGTVTLEAESQTVVITYGLESSALVGQPPVEPVTMSVQEQIRWGMAGGEDLEVLLPVLEPSHVMTTPGYLSNPKLSAVGSYFATFFYQSYGPVSYGGLYYNVDSGMVVTDVVPANADGVHFSPDGEHVGYQLLGATGVEICVVNLDGGDPTCFGGDGFYGWPFWSPDGEWLLFYSDGGVPGSLLNLYKARPDGSELTPLTSGDENEKIAPEWSPDGDWISYVVRPGGSYEAGELWVMDAEGENSRLLLEGISPHAHAMWNPDGSLLTIPGYEHGLWLVPVDDGHPLLVGGTEEAKCHYPMWAQSGDGWPLFVNCYSPETSEPQLLYLPEGGGTTVPLVTGADWGPIWSHDGRVVAFGTVDYIDEDSPVTTVTFFEMRPEFYGGS